MKRRLSSYLGLLVALATAACASTPTTPTPTPPVQPPPPPPPVLRVVRILSFGDSLTEGKISAPLPVAPFGLTPGAPESYPFKLQAMLTSRYTTQSIFVLNGFGSGEGAVNARARFNMTLSEEKPDLVLLIDGANDLFALRGQTVAAALPQIGKVAVAVEEMAEEAIGRGIPVMIGTLPPMRESGQRGGGAPFQPAFNELLRGVADEKGAQFVDLFSLVPLSLVGEDGLHLTEAGYQKIAEVFFTVIAQKFETH